LALGHGAAIAEPCSHGSSGMQFPSRRLFLASAALAPLAGCIGIPRISKGDPSAVAEANNTKKAPKLLRPRR